MGDRISELPELAATPAVDDLLAISDVSDPGTGTTKKITTTNLFAYLPDLTGWTPVAVAWAYASATTITVPAGADTIYSVGDKIRFKQGGAYKYYYVITVAAALLTVTGGSDYTVANAAITNIYYSKAATPVGFPQRFNFTTTWGGFTVTVPTGTFSFCIIGKQVNLFYASSAPGTSNAVTFTFTVPVAPLVSVPGIPCFVADNSVNQSVVGHIQLAAGNTTASVYKAFYQTAFTNAGNKDFYWSMISYIYI